MFLCLGSWRVYRLTLTIVQALPQDPAKQSSTAPSESQTPNPRLANAEHWHGQHMGHGFSTAVSGSNVRMRIFKLYYNYTGHARLFCTHGRPVELYH